MIFDEFTHAVIAAMGGSVVQQLRIRYRLGMQGETVMFYVNGEQSGRVSNG